MAKMADLRDFLSAAPRLRAFLLAELPIEMPTQKCEAAFYCAVQHVKSPQRLIR
ncbi:MAG: hypothetical protein RLY97_567 [Pseudomonadota bacterium]|jgi:hypothetical protein